MRTCDIPTKGHDKETTKSITEETFASHWSNSPPKAQLTSKLHSTLKFEQIHLFWFSYCTSPRWYGSTLFITTIILPLTCLTSLRTWNTIILQSQQPKLPLTFRVPNYSWVAGSTENLLFFGSSSTCNLRLFLLHSKNLLDCLCPTMLPFQADVGVIKFLHENSISKKLQ